MFQPNSIRSLLKKRNMSKLSSENDITKDGKQKFSKTCTDFSSISKNNTDPDLQSVIQAKMMIKQIDHDVSNIRAWRENQKQLLQEKLKNNEQIFNLSKEEYEKYVDMRMQQELIEDKKLIEKMKISENNHKKNRQNSSLLIDNGNSQTLESEQNGEAYEDWEEGLYDSDLMKNIAEADDKINRKKYQKSEIAEGFEDSHQAFINSINELSCSDIFSKKNNKLQGQQHQQKQNENKPMDKDLLKQQLDDIDRELRQMEELLKD